MKSEEVFKKLKLKALPKDIDDKCTKMKKAMEDREKQELETMKSDQESFKGTMEDIKNNVASLSEYATIDDYSK